MKVGFLGTGLMGAPMLQRLLAAEVTAIAYNRTPAKLEPLRAQGVEVADTPAAVLQAADCVILMLTDAQAIQTTLLSETAARALPGRTVIQMGTIAPTESKQIRDQVVAQGGEYLEAPVLGSIPEAQAGQLMVMVGASESQFEQWLSLLKHFGTEPLLIGPVGSATALKLALNQLIASLTTAFATSLGFVLEAGLEPEVFMKILRESALYAPTFDKKLQRMLEENYANPNFPTKHLLKDVNLFLTEAATQGIATPSLAGVQTILQKALALNLGESDYSALFAAIRQRPPA